MGSIRINHTTDCRVALDHRNRGENVYGQVASRSSMFSIHSSGETQPNTWCGAVIKVDIACVLRPWSSSLQQSVRHAAVRRTQYALFVAMLVFRQPMLSLDQMQ